MYSSRYIGCKVDVKYNSRLVFVYYNRSEIARHEILPKGIVNGVRTDESHLPFPLKKNKQAEDLIDAAREIGPNTFELIRRMYDEAKVKEQPTQTVAAILAIADTFTPDILEAACKKSLKQYHMPFYKTVYKDAENLNNQTCELKVCTTKKPENPSVFLTLPVAHELSVLCMI